MVCEKINAIDGGFRLENGFPNEYYAFTDGEVSATVERNGGINTLGCLDILEKDGKLYPDRGMTPTIFLREGNRCGGRPLYGPAVQFITTTKNANGTPGRNLFHSPDQVELHPFGFRSASERFGVKSAYDMLIDGKNVLFSFANDASDRDEFVVSISKEHIRSGESNTLKHQVAENGDHLEDAPFKENQTFTQTWSFIGFDEKFNGFVIEGSMDFPYGDKKVCVFIASNVEMSYSETNNRYRLAMPWSDKKKIELVLVIAETREEADTKAQALLEDVPGIFAGKIEKSAIYAEKSTRLSVENHPEVAPFSKTAPSFLRSMVLAETDQEACVRAATHKFGFFNLWDQVWPAKAFLLMGDWETAKKLVKYPISTLDGKEKKFELIYLGLFIIAIAEEIIAISGDDDFEKDLYEDLKRLFSAYILRRSENGLLPATGTSGIDDPAEIGITGDVWPSCLNSLWYDACRAMENLALRRNDATIAKTARGASAKIAENYMRVFFNNEHGYLYSSVDALTEKGIPVYQNVSTLGMDFTYGEALLRNNIGDIGKFQAFQLYHPAGRTSVPFWDMSHEMWKSVIMYQHIAHEMKTARAAGFDAEIERMMSVYLGHFRRNKVAIETHNLNGGEGDITQRANWQAFGTRALYSGIFESLIGIQSHLGGFYYAPGETVGKMEINGFKFRKGAWNISVDGVGAFCESFKIDGIPIHGSLQLPTEYLKDSEPHELSIQRSENSFNRPTLISAVGVGVCNLNSSESNLSLEFDGNAHATLKIYCPMKPTAEINEKEINADWDEAKNLLWIDALVAPGDSLTIVVE